jgi:hypothetical protein
MPSFTGLLPRTLAVSILLSPFAGAQPQTALVAKYCAGCHSQRLKTGGVVLEGLDPANAGANPGIWERVLRQVSSGLMPPAGLPRPDKAAVTSFAKRLEESLDRAAAAKPDPGAPMPHRLNRVEYSNAIRDLLAVDTNPGASLPVDDSGYGFDNMADLLSMSPALLERYMFTAGNVSRLAIGDLRTRPSEERYIRGEREEPDSDTLPFNARGGLVVRHYFPVDAEYEIRINFNIPSDGPGSPYSLRTPVKAGLHTVVVTFLRESAKAEESLPPNRRGFTAGPPPLRPPAEMDMRMDGAPLKRFQLPQRNNPPNIDSISIVGPRQITGRGDTLSRARIFTCRPATPKEEEPCARSILTQLSRRAFRRPVTEADLRPLMSFYRGSRAEFGDFDEGIQNALQAILVSPDFLFRVERDPKGATPGSIFRVSDHELASRLSFFLWSSIPDDHSLQLADAKKLRDSAALKAELHRMLQDPRSDSIISNFGAQWLYLRTLAAAKPDADIFATFDDSLRKAFQRETELFLTSIFREDRSVLELLDANYTYVNQRLAAHYRIPNVYGPHFRKVALPDSTRGGLLGHGSILTVTSYPNRTSVVQRGKWILENLLGTPPPPPPPDVPELKPKSKDGRHLSLREAMEEHRSNAVCSSCHARMDAIGFALENFNGIGEWRSTDGGAPIDARGKLPDGTGFDGPAGLRKILLEKHRDEFIQTFTEKLFVYALGRGLEPQDKPAVRSIVRQAARENYRMSAFLAAIVESVPFQMRRASER